MAATRAGDATTTTHARGWRFSLHLVDVLVLTGPAVNPLSVKLMKKRGFGAYFHDGGLGNISTSTVLVKGLERGNA